MSCTLLLRRPHNISLHHLRAFSTSLPRPSSLQLERNDASLVSSTVPAYPYPASPYYKQSNLGLYGTTKIQFGNNTRKKPDITRKTRRSWKPNILHKRLWSRGLNRYVQVRVSARVLRTVDKVGGLDEYLLGDKEGRVKELGVSGWWLRWAVMQTPGVRRRMDEERVRLGLPELKVDGGVEQVEIEAAVAKAEDALGRPANETHEHMAAEDDADTELVAEAQEEQLENESEVEATRTTKVDQEAGMTTRTAESEPSADEPSLEALDPLPPSTSTRPPKPLTFRTDRYKHLKLTPTGWVRAKPDDRLQRSILRKQISNRTHIDPELYITNRMAAFNETLEEEREELKQARRDMKRDAKRGKSIDEEVAARVEEGLGLHEGGGKKRVMDRARRHFQREFDGMVEREVELKMQALRLKAEEKRAVKLEQGRSEVVATAEA